MEDHMKTISALLIISFFILTYCTKTTNSNESLMRKTNEASNIRLKNDSDHDFENVKVIFPSREENFENLKKGEVTSYRSIKIAYKYAYIELFVENEKFVLQPIDYVGETPLGKGHFTYVLRINFEERSLNLTFKED